MYSIVSFYFFIHFLSCEAHLWNKRYLTYSVENDSVDLHAIHDAVQAWNISPVLELAPVARGQGDIKIYFKPLTHSVGLGYPPPAGIVIVDSNVSDTQLAQVIQHEIGHALGLKHSDHVRSIMRPHLIASMRILKSDKKALKELYKCRYDSVTLLNGHTYLKFYGRFYDRLDLNTGIVSRRNVLWHPNLTHVTALFRDGDEYAIFSGDTYFEFNRTMHFQRKGLVADKFGNFSQTITAVLTLKNETRWVFFKNNDLWYNNRLEKLENVFKTRPESPIQGAYSDFYLIYLVSKDYVYVYDENLALLNITLLCQHPQLHRIHCCNKYSNI